MEQYVSKSALVAEIEKRIKNLYPKGGQGMVATKILKDHYEDLHSFLDTLEVKEVDLDFQRFAKEMDAVFALPSSETKNTEENPLNWEYVIARHFFELGLKVQYDNWKVVDNINPPQADRNKIYCVLSKNKYLLARVVNHPQDEDLLQWKCTEFPFHRYDMCEGDKYMQIV